MLNLTKCAICGKAIKPGDVVIQRANGFAHKACLKNATNAPVHPGVKGDER